MLVVSGIYENGEIRLESKVDSKGAKKVIVTFPSDHDTKIKKKLSIKDFSFQQSRDETARYKGNISEAVVSERRDEV